MYWWCINERVIRGRGLPPHHPTTTVPIAVDGREAEEQLFHRSTEKKPIVPRKFTPFNKEDSNSCDALSFHFPVFHHEVGNERNPRSAGWFPLFFFAPLALSLLRPLNTRGQRSSKEKSVGLHCVVSLSSLPTKGTKKKQTVTTTMKKRK